MNVSLTPELEQFIYSKVKSGFYGSASEVIREGLRLSIDATARVPSPMYALRPAMSLRGLGEPASNLAAAKEMLRLLSP